MPHEKLYLDSIDLLKSLIKTPSLSGQEHNTADILSGYLIKENIPVKRQHNNVFARNKHFSPDKPTILLNSHHDTVKPNSGYTRDPFSPTEEAGRLFGLGSNDAGASVVSLLATFRHFYDRPDMKYNFLVAITGEEENSGSKGLSALLPEIETPEFAIVGEPTKMDMAIAEKGLMVLEIIAKGKSGHAAREEGDNAIYKAIDDIEWFRTYQFDKVSEMLGPVKMTVTMIEAGTQHNVVPDTCRMVADVRSTDQYTNEEVLHIITTHVQSEVKARSTRLEPSSIDPEHPVVKAGLAMGLQTYGSPTTSDQALLNCPSLKMGPGDSARSHTADEYIYLYELEHGIQTYINILEQIL